MKKKFFIKEIKSILFYALEYGINNVSFKLTKTSISNPENYEEFISKVHKGFMLAQNLIIQNLLLLGEGKKKYKNRLKEANREKKSKEIIDEFKAQINEIEYQEVVLRKVADSIAWQILGGDITVVRRLYNFSTQVEIYNSNLTHDLQVVEKIFKENNKEFPLLTDITSFIQVGDLLIKSEGFIKIVELKEGKVNEEISQILDEHYEIQCERKLFMELEEKDDKFIKQFSRYVKQQKTALNTLSIINKGEGTDNQGRNVKIVDNIFYTEHFTEMIKSMLQVVDKKNFSINYIEECLAIGVYNISKIPIHIGFEEWKKMIGIDFPTVDIRNFLHGPVNHPLFLHPFSIEDKVKIITGEKVILMSLNINEWLKMFEKKDAKVRFLTKKETAKNNDIPNHLKSFEYKGQAIEIEYSGIKQIIHGGTFERMFNQFQNPSSVVDYLLKTHVLADADFNE